MSISFLNKTKAAETSLVPHRRPYRPPSQKKKRKPGLAEGCFADHPSLRANQTKPSLRPWLSRILV